MRSGVDRSPLVLYVARCSWRARVWAYFLFRIRCFCAPTVHPYHCDRRNSSLPHRRSPGKKNAVYHPWFSHLVWGCSSGCTIRWNGWKLPGSLACRAPRRIVWLHFRQRLLARCQAESMKFGGGGEASAPLYGEYRADLSESGNQKNASQSKRQRHWLCRRISRC